MLDLTFGEQVKIILSRKGMTIKELAGDRRGSGLPGSSGTSRIGKPPACRTACRALLLAA